MRIFPRVLSLILTMALVVATLPAQAVDAWQNLQIQVVQSTVAAQDLNVKVTDGNGAAVADAAVAVRLPDSGATGTFADGSHSSVAYTDQSGTARISGIHWSAGIGTVELRITAVKGTAHAGLLFEKDLNGTAAAGVKSTPAAPPIAVPAAASAVQAAAPAVVATLESAPAQTTPEPHVEVTAPGQLAAPTVQITSLSKSKQASSVLSSSSSSLAATPSSLAQRSDGTPSVSVTNAPGAEVSHSSKKKWIFIAIGVAAAAGAGLAFAKSKGGSSTSTSGVTIGTPSVSIGHP